MAIAYDESEALRYDQTAEAFHAVAHPSLPIMMSTAIHDAHLLISQRLVVLDHMSQSIKGLRFVA